MACADLALESYSSWSISLKFHLVEYMALSSFSEELDSHSFLYSERISLLSKCAPCLYVSLHPLLILQQNSCFEKSPKNNLAVDSHSSSFLTQGEIPFSFFFPQGFFFTVKGYRFKVHSPYSSSVLLYKET